MFSLKKKWIAVLTAAAVCAAAVFSGLSAGNLRTAFGTEAKADEGVSAAAPGDPEGDESASDQTGVAVMALRASVSAASTQAMSPNLLVAAMLAKVGSGYSQANRYASNYYDCSSLVQRCMREIGITSYVPVTTYDWELHLKNLEVGSTYTFTGSQGTLTYVLAAKNVTEMDNPEYFTTPGTIMIYIAPNKSSGHIAVSLGSYPRQGSGTSDQVAEATIAGLRSWIEANFGTSDATLQGKSSLSEVVMNKMWMDTRYMGTDITISGTSEKSGAYNSIWRVEAFSPSYGVCIDNDPLGTAGNPVVRYVLVPVTSDSSDSSSNSSSTSAAAPTVDSITISNVSSSGYDVTATFTAAAGVSSVQMPTWTENNGQDDLIWYNAAVSGNTATYHVSTS
ncbi:MAG: GBS Bsp-like repeat-containing protein, partial [Lachnospiraceae bacterium]